MIEITTDDRGIKVYRQEKKDKNGNTFFTYSTKLQSKDFSSGEKKNSFITLKFKKDVVVDDKCTIKIKRGFPSFVASNPYSFFIFVMEFDVLQGSDLDNAFASGNDSQEWL